MSAKIKITSYDTDADLFASLSRVFGTSENNGVTWVNFTHDEVELTFFAPNSTEAKS